MQMYSKRQVGFTLLEVMLSLSLLSMVTVWQFADQVFADKQQLHEQTANAMMSVAEAVNLFWQQTSANNQTDQLWPTAITDLKRLTFGDSLLRNDESISIRAYQFNQSIDTVTNSTHVIVSRTSNSLAAAQAIALHIVGSQTIVASEDGFVNQIIVLPKEQNNQNIDLHLVLQDYYKLDGSTPLQGDVNANSSSITNINLIAANVVTANDGILILSDERLKHHIRPLTVIPEQLFNLTPIRYSTSRNNQPKFGFSAQQLEKHYPHLVVANNHGTKQVDYIQLIPLLLAHLQHLSTRLQSLEKHHNQ